VCPVYLAASHFTGVTVILLFFCAQNRTVLTCTVKFVISMVHIAHAGLSMNKDNSKSLFSLKMVKLDFFSQKNSVSKTACVRIF